MSHNPVEVERRIRERVAVDAQLLLLAKLHLTEHCASELESQLTAFAVSLGARLAQPVVIHPSTDVEVAIATTARYLCAQIAVGEAISSRTAATASWVQGPSSALVDGVNDQRGQLERKR